MPVHGRIPLSWERKTGLPITSECLHRNSELCAAQMLVPLARHSIHVAALQACDSRLEAQVWGTIALEGEGAKRCKSSRRQEHGNDAPRSLVLSPL